MSPFALQSFRLLFIGQATAQLADWLKLIALLGSVYALSSSVSVVALLFLTAVLGRWCGEYGGSLVQGKHPKHLMISIGLLRALVTSGLIGGLLLQDLLLIFLFLFGSSLLSSLFDPLGARLLAHSVSEKEVMPAAAALAVLANTAMVTGCVTVIVFSAVLSDVWMLVLSSSLYVVSTCSIGLVNSPQDMDEAWLSKVPYGQTLRAGVAFFKQQRQSLLPLFGLQLVRDVCFGALFTAVICKVLTTYAGGSLELGIIYLIVAVTYPLGTLLLNKYVRGNRWENGPLLQLAGSMLAFYIVLGCFVLLIGNWYVGVALLFVAHLLYAVIHSLIEDRLILLVPGESRRALMTFWQLGSRLMQGIGMLLFLLGYELVSSL